MCHAYSLERAFETSSDQMTIIYPLTTTANVASREHPTSRLAGLAIALLRPRTSSLLSAVYFCSPVLDRKQWIGVENNQQKECAGYV